MAPDRIHCAPLAGDGIASDAASRVAVSTAPRRLSSSHHASCRSIDLLVGGAVGPYDRRGGEEQRVGNLSLPCEVDEFCVVELAALKRVQIRCPTIDDRVLEEFDRAKSWDIPQDIGAWVDVWVDESGRVSRRHRCASTSR
jgi:hypothetical protein